MNQTLREPLIMLLMIHKIQGQLRISPVLDRVPPAVNVHQAASKAMKKIAEWTTLSRDPPEDVGND